MTAAYMFRLVFLTFHGERRRDAPAPAHQLEDESAAQAHHDAHGVGAQPHDAPPAMAFALIVLALGSVLAGYVGVPHALGGHNQLAAWLAPSFAAPGAVAEGLQVVAEDEVALEFTLMGVSTAIALGGIGIAVLIWLRRPQIAASMAMRHPDLHRLLLNKYFVDEAYDAAVVQPIRVGSERALWRGFDVRVIDGAVNRGRGCRGRQRGCAAPAPDRFGTHLCGFNADRCGRDPGLLPVVIVRGSVELTCC